MNLLSSRYRRRLGLLAAAGGILLIGVGVSASLPLLRDRADIATARALQASLSGTVDAGIGDFYAARDYRPLWTGDRKLEAAGHRVIDLLQHASDHGLDPDAYLSHDLTEQVESARTGRLDAGGVVRLEVKLSQAFSLFLRDMHQPAPGNDLIWVAGAKPNPAIDVGHVFENVALASGPTDIGAALGMHPDYVELSNTLAEWRRTWASLPPRHVPEGANVHLGERDSRLIGLRVRIGGSTTVADPDLLDADLANRLSSFQRWHGLDDSGLLNSATVYALNGDRTAFERRIVRNLDRLRALPAQPGNRYLIVNAAQAMLTAYAEGAPVKIMRVIVGRPETPTPMIAGLIQYAVLDPYWNIPEDLVRNQIAPAVLADGLSAFETRDLEALADWSPVSRVVPAHAIDCQSVAEGESRVRVRQRPGPDNMMGKVKFMLPNDLGIYLHDTPYRMLFQQSQRALSAGCVRLDDAQWLGEWLAGGSFLSQAGGEAERRLDLIQPTPVFITYQTVLVRPGGLSVLPDIYGRDI